MKVRTHSKFVNMMQESGMVWEILTETRALKVPDADVSEAWVAGGSLLGILAFAEKHGRAPFGEEDEAEMMKAEERVARG